MKKAISLIMILAIITNVFFVSGINVFAGDTVEYFDEQYGENIMSKNNGTVLEKAYSEAINVTIDCIPTYSGDPIEISPIVSVNNKVLVENSDYVLSFKNNVNAGNNAEVIVEGINNYDEIIVSKKFTIKRKSIVDIDLAIDDIEYTGKQIKPDIEIEIDGKVLEEGENKDYIVQYINNLEVGTGIVRIIGVNNYCGYKDVCFDIIRGESKTLKPDGLIYYNGTKYYDADLMYITKGTTISDTVGCDDGYCKIYDVYNGNKVIYSKNFSKSYGYAYTFEKDGLYIIEVRYHYTEKGYQYNSNGYVSLVTKEVVKHSQYGIVCEVRDTPERLVAEVPVEFGIREVYLNVGCEDSSIAITNPIWKSSDETIAMVDNGIVKIKKSGLVTITAIVDGLTAVWELELAPLDIALNTTVYYDSEKEKYVVRYQDEILTENTDYIISVEEKDEISIVEIEGVNIFSGSIISTFYADSKLPYIGHIYESVKTAPTCTDKGYTTYTCSVCGDSYVSDYVDALGHTQVIDEAVAPDCTNTGLTVGKHCNVCGEVLVKQEEIPSKGHNYISVVTKPTSINQGYTTYTCSACGDSYTDDYVPALGLLKGVTVNDIALNYKNSINLEPNIKIDEGVDYEVEFKSSNDSVATIDNNGNIMATGIGESEITVIITDEFGNKAEDTCKVTVSYAWWQWLIIIFLFGWIWY